MISVDVRTEIMGRLAIYMNEPEWYQAEDLEERRDVIEYPIVDDIDLNGCDLRKARRASS